MKTEESSAGEALPQHKHTNNLELEAKEEKKATKQCNNNNNALLLFGCTYLGCVHFPLCPFPADSFVNQPFKSDFSMHFVFMYF